MKLSYRQALRDGLKEAMTDDPKVILIGEDVGAYGGSYAVSKDLLRDFGPQRVFDAPLSESGFVGVGIGAALGGLRPIVEVMTVNFLLLALNQIINSASMYFHMSGGQFSVPLVIRMTTGGGRQLAAQHSNSLEGWLAHIPGLHILTPSSVYDARWMLKAALQEHHPVLIFEHASLLNKEEEVENSSVHFNISQPEIRRRGKDITIVTFGVMVDRCLQAAEFLQQQSIEVEIIDLRCLRPLDLSLVFQSIARTKKVLVVDEGWKTVGVSAEIIAQIHEQGLDLKRSSVRLCRLEVPLPYPRHLELVIIPQVEIIQKNILELVK